MGSRYRCRVSPSGVPGCVPSAATGPTGDGEPNLLEVIQSTLISEDLAAGITEDLVVISLVLEEDEAVVLYYRGTLTNISLGLGSVDLALRRDFAPLDSSNTGNVSPAESTTISSFIVDNPGPGTYDYVVTGESTGASFTADAVRLIVEVVRASIVT